MGVLDEEAKGHAPMNHSLDLVGTRPLYEYVRRNVIHGLEPLVGSMSGLGKCASVQERGK